MRFSVLASGSGGNACYIETDKTAILVDAGLSCSEILKRLAAINIRPEHFDALVLTHEHHDHIKGAGPVCRKFKTPLLSNSATLSMGTKNLGNISGSITVQTGHTIEINDIAVETFTKCHDAVDPIGIVISSNGSRLGIITDLGKNTLLVADRMKYCDAVLIEFNHDTEMLDAGPYPLYLKRRIKGAEGHLSNHQAGELLRNIVHRKMKHVILGHISEKNNLPEKALKEAGKVLRETGMEKIPVYVGSQDKPGPLMEI